MTKNVAANPSTSSLLEGGRVPGVFVVIGFAVAVVVVAIGRLALFGWAGIAPDDARYVFVGLSTLDGHGPITPSGNLFLLRSPIYGIALAAGRALTVDGPIAGARIVAVILTVAALLAAVRFGWSLGGPVGAAGTALALMAMPLIWRLLPTLRIDLPQAAGVVAMLLALHRPTARRWALAGVLFGLTVLVKETILLLALVPLAFAGSMPRGRLALLWGVFLAAAAVVAGWWWVVVWAQSGAIFPFNAVGVIERRDVGSDVRVDLFGVSLLGLIAAAWLVVLTWVRRDRGLRLLVAAATCLVPPAAYATLNGLSTRNYAGLAVLSAIALGVAGARIVTWLRAVCGNRARPMARAGVLALAAIVGVAGAAAGQLRVGNPVEPALPGELSAWLRTNSPPGSRVVMTFRYGEVIALELYGSVSVPSLAAVLVDRNAPLTDFLWIGLRDRQLFAYPRSSWEGTLGQTGTTHLVIAGPHPLTPSELVPTLDRGGLPGLVRARSIEAGDEWARIYRVEPTSVRARLVDVALYLSPAAAIAWLDLAGGPPGGDSAALAGHRLAVAGAVVVGPDTESLAERLVGLACLVPLADPLADMARIVPVGEECAGWVP
jgi:hypothetical protein